MVSDEPEQSGGNYSDFVNDIIAKKGNANNVRLSAIYNPGHHSGRYAKNANDTGGLLFHITDSSWANSNNLQLIAQASVIADNMIWTTCGSKHGRGLHQWIPGAK